MIIKSFGSSDVFEVADIAKPEIKAGHVLVNIAASSVNTVDTMIRLVGADLPLAPPLPAVLGMDFAGTVEALGEGVTQFSVGDEVYVAKHTGGTGFDVIFDSVGGENMTNSFNAAALNGQVASTVAMVELDLSVAHFKGLSLRVVFLC